MAQKVCANCQKELTPTERATDEILCAQCYARWLNETLPAAEPYIRAALDRSDPAPKK